jgi:hypothetical protein
MAERTMIPFEQVLTDLGVQDGMTVRADEIEDRAAALRAKLEAMVHWEVARCVSKAAPPELAWHAPVVAVVDGCIRISATHAPPPIPES